MARRRPSDDAKSALQTWPPLTRYPGVPLGRSISSQLSDSAVSPGPSPMWDTTDQGPLSLCLKLPPRTSGHSRAFLAYCGTVAWGRLHSGVDSGSRCLRRTGASGKPGLREPDVVNGASSVISHMMGGRRSLSTRDGGCSGYPRLPDATKCEDASDSHHALGSKAFPGGPACA